MKAAKSRVFLIELILVILFFALSSAAVLQLFTAANRQSMGSELRTQALVRAQDTAEQLRGADDPERLLTGEGFTAKEADGQTVYTRVFDRKWNPSGQGTIRMDVRVQKERPSEGGTLWRLKVSVRDTEKNGEDGLLCSLDADCYCPEWKEAAQ